MKVEHRLEERVLPPYHPLRARPVPRPLVRPELRVGARPARPVAQQAGEEVEDAKGGEAAAWVAVLGPAAVLALGPHAVDREHEAALFVVWWGLIGWGLRVD